MNTVLSFLEKNSQRLELPRYGAGGKLSALTLTPRFRASSHVVSLILAKGQTAPVLVAKVPRLANATTSLEREVGNLRQVQRLRPEGFTSIPRVVAFETYCGYPVLVETAIVGPLMDPPFVRRQRDRCCQAVIDWLVALQRTEGDGYAADPSARGVEWYQRLIEQPLHYFDTYFPLSEQERQLLTRTRHLAASLQDYGLPLVFEHGDLSHPNLMLLPNNKPGVVDWELAEPYGLPASDLFFFLTYAAFAMHKARESERHLPAFKSAFFGRSPWTQRYIRQYVSQLQLPVETLTPLFVVTWLRYVVGLLQRLDNVNQMPGKFSPQTVNWIRQSRYYALWEYAVSHADELSW